jgi:hypothetical protein
VLRLVDEEKWPILQKEQYHLVRFARLDVEAQPSPVGPVCSSAFVLNPGVGPSLSGPGYEIRRLYLQNITGRGVMAKGLLLEHLRLNTAGGLELLEYVEQGFEYGREVFGYDKSKEFDAVRPQRWVDPYPPFVCGICLSVNCRHWRDDSSIHLSGYNNCRHQFSLR